MPKLPEERFFNIICAWQHFAGKPIRVTDFAKEIKDFEYTVMEVVLRRLAKQFRKFSQETDNEEWQRDFHKLAENIDNALKM